MWGIRGLQFPCQMNEDGWLEVEVSGQQQSRVRGSDGGRLWAGREKAGVSPRTEATTGRQQPYDSPTLLPTKFALFRCYTWSGRPNFPAVLLSTVRFLCNGSKHLHGFSTSLPFPTIIPTKPLVKNASFKEKNHLYKRTSN